MQTHDDGQHNIRSEFMERLRARAHESQTIGASTITSGSIGEVPLAKWKHRGIHVTHMPDDEQGILRISVGGGNNTPVVLNYCTIRGSVGECIELLERTIKALRKSPE